MKVPWLSFVKSLPVWAVAIAHFTNNWGYYMLLTCLPKYLKEVLHFDMKSVSISKGCVQLSKNNMAEKKQTVDKVLSNFLRQGNLLKYIQQKVHNSYSFQYRNVACSRLLTLL